VENPVDKAWRGDPTSSKEKGKDICERMDEMNDAS
jgi:hypothetical protein